MLQVGLVLLDQVHHLVQLGVLQRVDGAGRKRQLLERLGQGIAQERLPAIALRFLVLARHAGGQRTKVVLEVGGGAGERVVGAHGAVRPHLDHQLFVIGDLPEPGHLDVVRHPCDGRIGGVERQRAGRDGGGRTIDRLVAAADADAELHRHPGVGFDREEMDFGVHHLDVGLGDVRARHDLRSAHLDPQHLGLTRRHLDRELLEIEQDIDGALLDARDFGLRAPDTVDPHPGHRRARHDREQGTPERVPDGERVALLEGLGDEPSVLVAQDLPLDLLRLLKRNTWHSLPYLLYSSTMSCSATGIWMSSRSGRLRTTPFFSFGSSSSHCGTWPRPALTLSSIRACSLEVGRSWIKSPTFTRSDGIDTFRPFTWKWPCATICRPSRREAANPSRCTTLSRRSSRSRRRFSPVTPFSASAHWKYLRNWLSSTP